MSEMEEGQPRSIERGPLTVRVRRDVVTVRIELDGELDMSSSGALEHELDRAAASDAGRIIIDLSGLNYIDSTGIGALARIPRYEQPERFRLLRAPQHVQRVLELAGLDEAVEFGD
jgi:anti-anti-sigma factor